MNLQELCNQGQDRLMAMRYLEAEASLQKAEQLAWDLRDWDTLSRLYMPLQEARRQIRQRCGEGIVRLDLIAQSEADIFDAAKLIEEYPHGQLLIADQSNCRTAIEFRGLARKKECYVETFLAIAAPQGVRILARPNELAGSVELPSEKIPKGSRQGTAQTYAEVMSLWERLHRPFLDTALAEPDVLQKMQMLRRVIEVDNACEIAHQELSHSARVISRKPITVSPAP